MKTLRLLFLSVCLALVAQAQRVPRTVPTVTDMLALDPASLATKTVGTNTSFEAVCITLGDTVAGVPGSRVWRYLSGATDATNLISQGGPLARTWGASTGRWFYAPQVGTITNSVDGRSTNELAAFGAGGALGGSGLPVSKVPYLTNLTGDVQGAINSLSSGKFGVSSNAVVGELLIATGTNTAAPSGVTMTHLSNLPRVVSTAADLVAVPPSYFASGLASNAVIYVETSGDTVPGSGKKTWWYSAAATFATNTAASNGPIAYPWGASSGRWLYVPEANFASTGATVSAPGVSGQLAVATGANSIGPSGFTTNLVRNLGRVVLTVADLIADDPTNLLAVPGGTAAWVQTSGDTVANSGFRFWTWVPASTAVTNTPAKGGPIAYPQGGSTGRWEQVAMAGMLAPTDRILSISPLYADDASGNMHAFDPSTNIQTAYDTASALYDPYMGKVRVLHPAGQFTGGELLWRKNVKYWAPYVFHYRKRFQPSGASQRSVATTVRLGGATLDSTDGSFLSWNASGGTNNYFATADNWYGLSDGMEFGGEGKFIFDQAQKDLAQPLLRLLEVRDMVVSTPGVIECWLAASTNANAVNSYAIQLCGRNVLWPGVIVRGGTVVTQDGLHIGWGNNITILGGYSMSGDDSLAFQAEASGGSTLPPDEPLENVLVMGWNADPLRARACVIHAGVNWINAPYVNRTPELRNVQVNGIYGYVSKQRQSAMQLGNFQDGSGIWSYTIDNPGSGYTNGYYWLPITATGGGSGAAVVIQVASNSVVRAYPAKGGTGTGWLVNNTNNYAIGATNIAVDTGTGTILAGDKVKFQGDNTTYTVWSTLSAGSINLTSGILSNLVDNATMTITSSSGSWKTGTGYTADQTAIMTGLVPGGSGAVVTGVVFGVPNNRIAGCAIRNFNLISGGVAHDGTEPYGIRLHGATDCEIGPGYITLIENTNAGTHRPLFIEGAKDCTIRGVTIVSSTTNGLANGGAINVTKFRSVVDGLRIVDCKWGPIRNSGNGLLKVNGTTVGKVSLERDKLIVGSGMSGLYLPDYESSKTCYITNLNVADCEFIPVDGATSTKAVNFVANAGGTGLVCGMFRFVNNDVTGITTFNTAAQLQAATTAYEIRDNRGGYRTKLQFTVTQNSGATTVSVPVSTYTGLLDNTVASLPQITSITPYDYLGNFRLRVNSTTAATLETASAPSSNVVWGVTVDTSRKPLTGY